MLTSTYPEGVRQMRPLSGLAADLTEFVDTLHSDLRCGAPRLGAGGL